jgi:hypothetical protein
VKQPLIRLLAVGGGAVLLISANRAVNTPSTMSQTAVAFLSSLKADQRGKVTFQFKDEERFFWHYIPTDDIPTRYKKPRMGLTFGEMTPEQRPLASALLAAGLSQSGYIKAAQVMSLEEVLKVMEKDTRGRRNPERYHFSVFGDPAGKDPWGYRVEGHHLSFHFTVVNGKVVGAPTFYGANPHEVREGSRAGLRVLAREEDLGRELVNALNADQKKVAIVDPNAYKDILTEANRKAALTGQPSGLSASKMNAKQRELLTSLVAEYAHNLSDDMAAARMEALRKAGTNVHFAWAGSTEKGGPHYYRVQTPAFLIEYDNTQNGANHSHTVWRDFTGDFGEDALKAHYSAAHK